VKLQLLSLINVMQLMQRGLESTHMSHMATHYASTPKEFLMSQFLQVVEAFAQVIECLAIRARSLIRCEEDN